MAETKTFTFQKLKGRLNYDEWKVAAKSYLTIKSLWDVVSGKYPPTESPEANLQAISEITLMIEPSLYNYIVDSNSAKDVWDGISSAFGDSGTPRKVTILNQLVSIKLENFDKMESYVNEVLLYWHKSKIAGFSIEEQVIASLLLGGLPSEYRALILAVENSSKELTVDYVKTVLLQGITEPVQRTNGERAMQAIKASTSGTQRSTPKKKKRACYKCGDVTHFLARCPKKDLRCFECDDIKHLAKNCPRKRTPKKKEENKEPQKTLVVLLNKLHGSGDMKEDWYIDSGATAHMCNDRRFFRRFRDVWNENILIANSETLAVEGVGDIQIEACGVEAMLKNVNYVPGICTNLLSVKQITEEGHSVSFEGKNCAIRKKDGTIIATGYMHEGMYRMKIKPLCEKAFLVESVGDITDGCDEAIMWHRKLGHPSYGKMRFLQKHISELKIPSGECKICLRGKQTRLPFVKRGSKTMDILELVYMDVNGPMQQESLGGHRYFLSIVDDLSKKVFVYLLKAKSDVFGNFIEWKNVAENQTGKQLKRIRTDNGGEFINRNFEEMCKTFGIIHEKTIVYTPQQNGVAERMNRTIMEKTRCLLFDSDLDKTLWGEAVMTAVYLINVIPKDSNGQSANQKWNGEDVDLCKLRIFGERAIVHIPRERRRDNKLDERGAELFFVGYAPNGYRFFDRETKQISIRRDVRFLDNEIMETDGELEAVNDGFEGASCLVAKDNECEEQCQSDDDIDSGICDGLETQIPKSYEQAMVSSDAEKWLDAMADEYQSLIDNGTWTLEKLPEGKKAVKCKWVYATKRDVNGKIIKFKARVVAKGFSQTHGIDYEETFSPVVRYTSIRMLMAIAAHEDLEIIQMDAVTAFLNGKLEEDVYMEQPKHYDDGSGKYCKLIKSLYGLKQSSRVWNQTINKVLLDYGLEQCKSDQCIYFRIEEKDILIITIYVDDILAFYNKPERGEEIQNLLSMHFKMKILGPVSSILGVRVVRNRALNRISIDQELYIEDILKRFQMSDCNPVTSPMDVGQRISRDLCPKSEEEKEDMRSVPYREAIGSLLFLGMLTRPDITFATNFLARYCENPGRVHWGAVKRIFRYLRGTSRWKLTFGENDEHLVGYTDSDWAADLDQRKSTSAYLFTLYGGAISWSSKRQPTTALSSTEAEYMALVATIQEAMWLGGAYKEIFGNRPNIKVLADNKGAIQVVKNCSYSSRTKHIDIRMKFIKEKLDDVDLKIEYLPTDEMPADILTKPAPASKILKHTPRMGLNHIVLEQ